MAQKLEPQIFRGFHRGMADASVVADSLMPQNQMRLIQNMDTDAIGYLTGRYGYSQLGSAAVISGNTGLGLHHHIGTNSQIVAFINQADDSTAEAYYLATNTWTNKALGFTANLPINAITFLDYIIAVNGTDNPKSWTGSAAASWGSTLLSSAPVGNLIESFKQQVFIIDGPSDTAYFSSVPSAGSITWPAANNFVINPNDGDNTTAVQRLASQLLFIKNKFIYRYNGKSLDPDPVVFFGAPSQQATTVANGTLFFFDANKSAIINFAGGYPDIISKPVRSFLKAIPTSNFDNVVLRGDEDHVEACIGDVTVDGVAFSNVALRYVISTRTWVIRTYANEFTHFTLYDNGTTLSQLGFTTNGYVVKMDNGNDDLGTSIAYKLETAWLTIGNNPSIQWTIGAFAAYAERARGLQVQYKTDLDDTWRSIGVLSGYVTSWSGINAQFHRIKFRFTGTSSGAQAIFDGFSILTPVLEGIETETPRLR